MPVEEILNLEAKPIPKSKTALKLFIRDKENEMKRAAQHLDFELAAILRDEIKTLSKEVK